jgi:hypothetical protein
LVKWVPYVINVFSRELPCDRRRQWCDSGCPWCFRLLIRRGRFGLIAFSTGERLSVASHKSGLALCGRLLEWSSLLYFDGGANSLAQSLALETVAGFRCWLPRQWGSVSCESWTSGNATPRLGQTIHIQLFCSFLWYHSHILQALPSKATTPSAAPSYPAPSCASPVGFHRLPLLADSPDLAKSSHQSFYLKI